MNIWRIVTCVIIAALAIAPDAYAIRIKDIAHFKGVRDNQLIGYGIVAGLNDTGDDDKTKFSRQSLVNMLEKMGIVVDVNGVKVDNMAAVVVTATLPPFAKVGTKIDVVVSSIGNADSLQGGTLLMTPLKAPNGEVYAVAQGPISIGGFSFGGAAGGGVQKNHPTVGMIAGGAIIEKEVPLDLNRKSSLEISLNQPDFTTCLRMAEAIKQHIGSPVMPIDAGTLSIPIPDPYLDNKVAFMAALENLEVQPDMRARVVLNERTGTVVMGDKVRIATVAISHGNLSIVIKEQPAVSQPMPFSQGQTVVVPQTEVRVEEQKSNLILLQEGPTIGDVVRGLNAMGVTPRDLIAILQAIKAAGALQADLEII
ncbi:MAG: flagellar basal body P-ring protein FlgI [Desulfobacterota bacterium]|nr:flagellar basal body P-ring protein FlgI [Thermodesulfobacteriota bacterium]